MALFPNRSAVRILMLHNYYQWSGGEDRIFENEIELLRSHGHTVTAYSRHNRDIEKAGKLRTACETFWNPRSYREIGRLIESERPDLMHCHNTFPLLGPAVYAAAAARRVPIVQSLHNFRMVCPDAGLFRQGRVCQDCLGKAVAWPGLRHACYHQSLLGTAVVVGLQSLQRWTGSWHRQVTTLVATSEYVRQVVLRSGLKTAPVMLKYNFVGTDSGVGDGAGGYYLFVGRLTPEKGIDNLLRTFGGGFRALKILGAGPLHEQVQAACTGSIEYLGQRGVAEVARWMRGAKALVVPSHFPEPFGLVVAEAFACGTPVLAAASGALPELIREGVNGYLFRAGDSSSFQAALERLERGPDLRCGARASYEERFTAAANYRCLLDIYQRTLERAASR